jgi:hypothetical protein
MKEFLPKLMFLVSIILTIVGVRAIRSPTDDRPTTAIDGTPAPVSTAEVLVSSAKTGCSAVVDANHREAVAAMAKHIKTAGFSMSSPARLANAAWCVLDVIERGLEGDIVKTGVWRRGVSMVMRKAALITKADACHESWLCDSFEGLPAENAMAKSASAAWKGKWNGKMGKAGALAIQGGVETVKGDVQKTVGGNTDTIHFVKGWFHDTVFIAPISKIAVLRLDGDLYSSTIDVLHAFYDKVVPTGYVIIDDYGHWPQCAKAIHDYFDNEKKMNITSLLKKVDYTGYYFQKPE